MNRTSFWWGKDVGVFLFPGLEIRTEGSLIATCICLGSLAFLFEYLKLLQTKHRQKVLVLRSKQIRNICPTESSTLLNGNPDNAINITLLERSLLYTWEGFLCLSLQNLGYILMLAVMIYDAWFLIAVVAGSALGYFFFGQIFMKINLQNCQIIRETFCALTCEDQEPVTEILGGPDLFINMGSTINLTCLVKYAPEPPPTMVWSHNSQVINFDSPRGGISLVTEKGVITTSRLLIQKAVQADSGLYTCTPSNANAANVRVHILNGEHPAAMHHGHGSLTRLSHVTFLLSLVMLLILRPPT